MELKLETQKFEKLQAILIEEIIDKIRIKLQEGGLKDRELEDLTTNIAFSIASILDDTSVIESDGVEVKPYLTFQGEEDEIIHCGENSYTYEYVLGILNKFFDKKDTE